VSCHKRISDFEFEAREIGEAVRQGRLLSMEIEFSQKCNFECKYCYVPGRTHARPELSAEESKDAILQAREMGAKKIIVLGGEPMIYPLIREMIEYIRSLGLDVEVFTNGSQITADMARFLAGHQVRVALKMNSRQRHVQDVLCGRDGAHEIIWDAFRNLQDAGYPAPDKFLAVSTVICRDNADELVELWAWLREQNIEPYFEMITPQGNAARNETLDVPVEKARAIFQAIAEIDRTRYGIHWDPQPPLVGGRCLRHCFSCLLNAYGDVMPCVGVTIPLGNIREKKLKAILRDSEVLQDLRNYQNMIKGPCAACDKAMECYGCRGAAYQMTGDYLASDPMCWHNTDRETDIVRLPAPVGSMIPHAAPMRLVDTLLMMGERTAVVEMVVPSRGPFVADDGRLDETAYLEILAQAAAVMNGFRTLRNGALRRGYLVGAQGLQILGEARAGDRLQATVFKETRYGDFGVVQGTITRGSELLAKGEIKVWHEGGGVTPSQGEPPRVACAV
jgi:radical SAM protein with 4Fe4S-binding SPASM domain